MEDVDTKKGRKYIFISLYLMFSTTDRTQTKYMTDVLFAQLLQIVSHILCCVDHVL